MSGDASEGSPGTNATDYDDGSGCGYAFGTVLFIGFELAIAVFAGTFWHLLLQIAGVLSVIAAIAVGYVRIRRRRSEPSEEGWT